MGHLKLLQVYPRDVALQFLVLKLGYPAAGGADEVMVGFNVERFFILGRIAESVLDEQLGIEQKHDGVVERGAAHPEVFFLQHGGVEGFDVEMPVDGVDSVEYGKTLGRLAMLVGTQIFGEYLLHSIFYIVHVHKDI